MSPSSACLSPTITMWTSVDDIMTGWPVIQQMYPQFSEAEYRQRVEGLLKHNYRQFAYLIDEQPVGVIGLWLFPRLWCGIQADIDNFVVDEAYRSKGIGKALVQHCEAFAKAEGADVIVLDTYVDNPASHRFYFREGYTILGYHFEKPLKS